MNLNNQKVDTSLESRNTLDLGDTGLALHMKLTKRYDILLIKDNTVVGVLDLEKGTFEGDVQESARIFFEQILKDWKEKT